MEINGILPFCILYERICILNEYINELNANLGDILPLQRWAPNVTGEKMEIIFFPDRGSNLGRLRDRPTLYRVAIKAGLYRKAVQVYHIPIPGDRNIYK